jgi:uncharacterized protein YndB with AHSA1/START domain
VTTSSNSPARLAPIVHAVTIAAPPQRVWDTLTCADGWNAWFTHGSTMDCRPGGAFSMRWSPDGPYPTQGNAEARITTVESPTRFAFEWNTKLGGTLVTFELQPLHDSRATRLGVTDAGFPDSSQGRHAHLDCAIGWGEAMTLLKIHLEHGRTYRQALDAVR